MSRLNALELALMDSPARRLSQRLIELRTFRRLLRRAHVDLHGARLLDAGCGNGYGLELLARAFSPRKLAGFDLMPEQVERAKQRRIDAEISVGDITAIDHADGSFDGVFVFGILHHVPRWRDALGELARVLRPGGALLVEEIHGSAVAFQDRFIGTSHPIAARFEWPTFRRELEHAGLTIAAESPILFGAVRSFAAIRRSVNG